jgi:hypothetical protein
MVRCKKARIDAAQKVRSLVRPSGQPSLVDIAARPDVPTLVPHQATIWGLHRPRKPQRTAPAA